MAQKALANDDIGEMTDEVMRFIQEKKVRFNLAFAWAAHRRGIYHYNEPNRYNYFFREVHTRYKKRDRAALKKALTGPRLWQHNRSIKAPLSQRYPRLKPGIRTEVKDDSLPIPHNTDEDYTYPDNFGYTHPPNTFYLQEAPER